MKESIVSTSMLLEPRWILIPWEYFDGEGKSPRSLSHDVVDSWLQNLQVLQAEIISSTRPISPLTPTTPPRSLIPFPPPTAP
jgi:hypothetical protein